MIGPSEFVSIVRQSGFNFFTGVPDSLLKEFCACATDQFSENQHLIAANEGAAVGLAAGYYLATGKPGLVYMQNSGTGNAINPLLSLADPDVYSIPMLVMIGWRGEPGVKDEPQHVKQGKVQEALIQSLGYASETLSSNMNEAKEQLSRLSSLMTEQNTPVVLLVRKGTFSKYEMPGNSKATAKDRAEYTLSREQALEVILDTLSTDTRIISTTGMTSREIFELREQRNEGHHRDFLTVGSMGHAGMIALGLANFQENPTVCIDGDGASLMHMGAMPLIAHNAPSSFVHIIINNGAHDSVGGQPTIGNKISFARIAKACGYPNVDTADTADALQQALVTIQNSQGPGLLEVKVKKGARSDLGRPTTTPIENRTAFMEKL